LRSDDKDKPVAREAERDEGFLSRWSRRKLESGEAEPGHETTDRAPTRNDDTADQEPQRVLTDEDMPPLEELGEESDYSAFFSTGVSEKLRQAALRKLFRGAKFNVCDGLDDYAEDYTKFIPRDDVVSADMRYRMERALEKLTEDVDATEGEQAPATTAEKSTGPEHAAADSGEVESVEGNEDGEDGDVPDRV